MPDKIKASHILITVAEDDESDFVLSPEEAEAKINGLKKELDDGADFAALAKEHSDCPSGAEGGELGQFGPNDMVPSFGAAALAKPVYERLRFFRYSPGPYWTSSFSNSLSSFARRISISGVSSRLNGKI
jgi:hypothetical protein